MRTTGTITSRCFSSHTEMFLKARKPSTNPQFRSLLQKAVRRGYSDVVARVLWALEDLGDDRWTRSRLAVIAAEECWTQLSSLEPRTTLNERVRFLQNVAEAEKQKDAAGLGTLAYGASELDDSVFDGTEDDRTIKILAAAIKRPDDYWAWLTGRARDNGVAWQVQKMQSFVPRATWPWDKAFILASAYLAVERGTTLPNYIGKTSGEFPFWVAIDKHTDEGKLALREAARRHRCSSRKLNWVSYYCEGANVNSLGESRWWMKEKKWRLGRVGLTTIEADELWNSVKDTISDIVREQAEQLKAKILQANDSSHSPMAKRP